MTSTTVIDRVFGIRPSLRAPAVFLILFATFGLIDRSTEKPQTTGTCVV